MQKIIDSIDVVLDFLRDNYLGIHAVNHYQSAYRTIGVFCKNKGLLWFSHSEAMDFTNTQKIRYENGRICKDYFNHLRKSAYLLADCMQGNELKWQITYLPEKSLNKYFTHVINEWEVSLAPLLAPSTIKGTVSYICQFLFFLEDAGVYDFTQLTEVHVKLFLESLAATHQSSMGILIWSLRKFQSFLNETNLSMIKANRYLLNPAPNQKKVLPRFTEQDIKSILSTVDTTTPLGKRDYAILKLAIGTGLRGVDIFGLEMRDINWHTCKITLIQSKTDDPIYIPLLPDVGNAVADYILHARPESKSCKIFLRSNSPYNALSVAGNGRHTINRYLEKAGVDHKAFDGKTFHAVRRTYGTHLLETGVPLHSVAQLLGHISIESAKRYISLNDTMLRMCCLGISEYATRKEGLV